MALSWISIARLVTLSLGLLFGFVSIAIGGHMLSLTALTYDFEGLAVACGVFNLITLPPGDGYSAKRHFLTMNVVEIPVLGFLTVLWLAESILLTQAGSFFFASTACGNVRFAIDRTFCQEISALQGLSFVLWIFFFGYVVTTITFCIIGKSRGNDVWLVSATEAKYFEVNATAPQNEGTMMMAPGVQPQYTGVPQQVPQQQYQAAQQYPSPAPSQGNPVYAQPQQQYSPAPTSQHTGYAGQAQV